MDIIKGYRLEKNRNGYTLIIYANRNSVEFARIGKVCSREDEECTNFLKKYVEENFKDFRINAVKLMLGGMLIALMFIGTGKEVQAATHITYTVIAGDSLWKISQDFGVDIQSVREENNLTADIIYPGQKLRIEIPLAYEVNKGDTLWKISQKYGVSVNTIKRYNNIQTDDLYIGQELYLQPSFLYNIQEGDTLWHISHKYGTTIEDIMRINNLKNYTIYPGQTLEIISDYMVYTVQINDTLWNIAMEFGITVQKIKEVNSLQGDLIYPGQRLLIPPLQTGIPSQEDNTPVYKWPEITYIVQPGDNLTTIAQKFNSPASDILRYNYMNPDDWFDAGDKIAISGYAPRNWTVTPGESAYPEQNGKLVDWFAEGQYIIKRNDVFLITDTDTGRQFEVQMIGGYNHSDIEPMNQNDTDIMLGLFGLWQWSPRAVVIFKDGINIAASLSGMPHSVDTIKGNGVSGHFDLYLFNSTSHNSASQSYIDEHHKMVIKASGI